MSISKKAPAKLTIQIELKNASFEDDPAPEIKRILSSAIGKVRRQLDRAESLCKAPEADDKLLDINGNTVGTIKLE